MTESMEAQFRFTGGGTPDDNRSYVHDFERCDVIGRKVSVVLAAGNYEGAFNVLRHAIENDLAEDLVSIGETSIADSGISMKTANGLEEYLGILFVHQFKGVTERAILDIPNFGDTSLNEIIGCLDQLGVPFPVPEFFEFTLNHLPDPKQFHVAPPHQPQPKEVAMSNSLVHVITNATDADIRQIDQEIERLQETIEKLKRAKKVLGGGTKEKSTKRPPGELAQRIIELLEEHGAMYAKELAKRLNTKAVAIHGAAHHSSELNRDDSGIISLAEASK